MFRIQVVLFLSLSAGLGDENCDFLGVLLYEDIGCESIKIKDKICPVSFKCPSFDHGNGTCTYRKHTVNKGELLDEDETYANCRAGCVCQLENVFQCAVISCPEWFSDVPLSPGCYRTFSPEQCCSTGEKCVETKTNNNSQLHIQPISDLAFCLVDGVQYREGERFSSPDSCSKCVCQKGFKGKFVEPYCKRQSCSEQFSDSDKLSQNCAPVYFDDKKLCCPDAYVCPKEDDKIKQISHDKKNANLKCNFGKRDVKLGEGLETKIQHWGESEDVKCECILPPFLTCKKIN